jgi:hypothetical protein
MFEDLYNIYKNQNTETVSNNADPVSSPAKGVPMAKNKAKENKSAAPGYLAKANFASKKYLGSVGRPVAVAAATTAGVYAYGQKYVDGGIELQTAAISGVATAAVVEGVFYLWGDDTQLQLEKAVGTVASNPKESVKLVMAAFEDLDLDSLVQADSSKAKAS